MTPIILSLVTKSCSCASLQPSVPAGRCGNTMYLQICCKFSIDNCYHNASNARHNMPRAVCCWLAGAGPHTNLGESTAVDCRLSCCAKWLALCRNMLKHATRYSAWLLVLLLPLLKVAACTALHHTCKHAWHRHTIQHRLQDLTACQL